MEENNPEENPILPCEVCHNGETLVCTEECAAFVETGHRHDCVECGWSVAVGRTIIINTEPDDDDARIHI